MSEEMKEIVVPVDLLIHSDDPDDDSVSLTIGPLSFPDLIATLKHLANGGLPAFLSGLEGALQAKMLDLAKSLGEEGEPSTD